MVRRMGFPDAVRTARLELLASHLDRLSGVMVTPDISWWWTDLATDHGVTIIESVPQADVSVVVGVDQIRRNRNPLLSTAHGLGPAGRLVFSEIAAFDGRSSTITEFDVTASIWAGGMTVIDVDRVPIATTAGTWQLVGGIARVTPDVQTGETDKTSE